ncbi:hypothetical protein BKA01_007709 [Pseudonocardia eucalypti]|uniref:hypothetical protein n=1 Tax=Pseudonocardia eucalypti TaxID=648755 RepID=UPI001613EA4E|nr:hypothetical protein [Pseudonocardia eucalypti]
MAGESALVVLHLRVNRRTVSSAPVTSTVALTSPPFLSRVTLPLTATSLTHLASVRSRVARFSSPPSAACHLPPRRPLPWSWDVCW